MSFIHPPLPLQGELVTLSRFEPSLVDERYLGWLNDAEVLRFSNQRFRTHNRDNCLAYLKSFEGSDNLFLSVRRKDDALPIGTMTAYFSIAHGTVDIGIMIGERKVWGRGYGQDAWNTLQHALSNLDGIRKITAGTLASNSGMLNLMQRSGMHLEAVRKEQELVDGVPTDIHFYARFCHAE